MTPSPSAHRSFTKTQPTAWCPSAGVGREGRPTPAVADYARQQSPPSPSQQPSGQIAYRAGIFITSFIEILQYR